MANLIYDISASLDGYISDENGNFDWSVPDEQVHSFINERQRSVGTILMGRRMYETLEVWDRPKDLGDDLPEYVLAFADIWAGWDKIVFSTTLDEAATRRTEVRSSFDPEAVRRLKEESARDLSIGGPHLAAAAFDAGLVDECQIYVVPVVIGGGNPMFRRALQGRLQLLEQHQFDNGTLFLRYRVSGS